MGTCAPGCASYTHKALQVRKPLVAGDYEAARVFLEEKKPGGDQLPYLMELGLVLRYQEKFDESNRVFDQAEIVVDELYTKSISKEVAALVTSDETVPYDGEMWERVLINYYRALNYIDLGLYEDALVECRKINHKLKVYTDSSDDPPTYRTDAFSQYMTAVLYEAGGEVNDAWVSLRLADQGYEHYETAYGVAPPVPMRKDLLRLADQQGYVAELEKLRERYPEAELVPTSELLDQGEIFLFYEEGFIPAKIQREITIPLLKTEYSTDHAAYARKLSRNAYETRTYKKTELKYLLRVALPDYPPPRPGGRPYAVVQSGERSSRTVVAEDLEAIARRGLQDRMGGILFKTIVRGLTKYALTQTAEKENKTLGTIVNLFTAAAEKADTRSWITLPRTIQVARLLVEPGTHDVVIRSFGPSGEIRGVVAFEDVEVGPGQVRFLSHRGVLRRTILPRTRTRELPGPRRTPCD